MILKRGQILHGPAGTATEILMEMEPNDKTDISATLASWFLDCPGQSPAWRHFHLAVIHLAPIPNVREPVIRREGATHEYMMFALDPSKNPVADDIGTWRMLTPHNLEEQVILPSDEDAIALLKASVYEVLHGRLWAEPPLSLQVEPWREWLRASEARA